jgi:hypothetical protein
MMSAEQGPIEIGAVRALLGLRRPVPTTLQEMSQSLRVLLIPGTRLSPRLQSFGEKLRTAFQELGVRILESQEAFDSSGNLIEGVVPVFVGERQLDTAMLEQLPLQNLYSSQMVGIFDRRSPLNEQDSLQDRLDAVVEVMTSHLVTQCVFVTDERWCLCTMNGAVANYDNGDSITSDVETALIPKLAARVMPPRVADITCHYEKLDPLAPEYRGIVADFQQSIEVWAESGLITAHTSVSRLQFRSPMHRLLVTSYLDDRSGMSYGFLAWQLPLECEPAVELESFGTDQATGAITEREGRRWVRVRAGARYFAVPIPEVSVLCTRSGFRKDQMNPARDLVRMTLSQGKILMDTPQGITRPEDCRPSYETLSILGIAVGNCLVASILNVIQPESRFARALSTAGLSMSHWHGYMEAANGPQGYLRHGADNPGVCCSTPQSAIYALAGKLKALDMALQSNMEFLGDVHLEPHHGTNLCGVLSLTESARIVQRLHTSECKS